MKFIKWLLGRKTCDAHQMGKRLTDYGTEYFCTKCGKRL